MERGVPLPTGGAAWGGGCAPPQKCFSIFELKKTSFGAFWVLFLQLNGNWLGHFVACTDWVYMISNQTIWQTLAVTKLNIKQAPIERKPGPGMTRGYDVIK